MYVFNSFFPGKESTIQQFESTHSPDTPTPPATSCLTQPTESPPFPVRLCLEGSLLRDLPGLVPRPCRGFLPRICALTLPPYAVLLPLSSLLHFFLLELSPSPEKIPNQPSHRQSPVLSFQNFFSVAFTNVLHISLADAVWKNTSSGQEHRPWRRGGR